MSYFGSFTLDKEKDIMVDLYLKEQQMSYVLRTPHHKTGNLVTNLAHICELPLSFDANGLKVIEGQIPCYVDGQNKRVYIFRLRGTKVANIYEDGTIEKKASIPAISKTLMSQTKDYRIPFEKTIVKTYILNECKFHTDLHTHMNANLHPDLLMALGIHHQIRYPYYYVKKLKLRCTKQQIDQLEAQRALVAMEYKDSQLKGKYLDRKIDDHTFINFADLILNNLENAVYNIPKIAASLTILKDGQAVFTNLEKVYLYRYVFAKGIPSESLITLHDIDAIPDAEMVAALHQMEQDRLNPHYKNLTLFQDKLLWTARSYQKCGIEYVEISDTTLVKKKQSVEMLKQVHEVMPYITEETGVLIRFLASLRRIPLTIVKDQIEFGDYFQENLQVLQAICIDPYVAGSDIVGEEINDIRELKPVIEQIVRIAREDPTFVIRIHAGENDGLRDNVDNSIRCVYESLQPGQPMPKVRIGHGLYTANLSSSKGKQLIQHILKNHVVLEFQITSNVRLNNLSRLEHHPLRQYIRQGVSCVQGTDGGALYGTDSIDEQLSLNNLLNLSKEDFMSMVHTEQKILQDSYDAFERKQKLFDEQNMEEIFDKRLHMQKKNQPIRYVSEKKVSSRKALKKQIREIPMDKKAIILVGGSFNNDRHVTKMRKVDTHRIDTLLEKADPDKVLFVIGHTLTGYERYLVDHNHGKFEIYAFVPSMLNDAQIQKLRKSEVSVRVSIEPIGMGIYKSYTYEIFQRREAVLIAFDGNSAGVNMIQEAKNGKHKAKIYVSEHCRILSNKAKSLEGYVTVFDDTMNCMDWIK